MLGLKLNHVSKRGHKSQQLIWRAGFPKYQLKMPHLQISRRGLITWQGTRIVAPVMTTRWHTPSSVSVNTMQAMTSLGSVFMFPCGILVNRFGCRIVSIIGALFGILAYGLVALATHTRNFHEEHPFLLHCYFLASSKVFSSHLPRSSWSYMVCLLLAH